MPDGHWSFRCRFALEVGRTNEGGSVVVAWVGPRSLSSVANCCASLRLCRVTSPRRSSSNVVKCVASTTGEIVTAQGWHGNKDVLAPAIKGDSIGGAACFQYCLPLPLPTQWRTGGVATARNSFSELAALSSELRSVGSKRVTSMLVLVSQLHTGGADWMGGGRPNSANLGDAIAARMFSSVDPGGMQSPISERNERAGGCGGVGGGGSGSVGSRNCDGICGGSNGDGCGGGGAGGCSGDRRRTRGDAPP